MVASSVHARAVALVIVCAFLLGCTGCTTRRYKIDFSESGDLAWDGRVLIVQEYEGLFQGWKVHHVEIPLEGGGSLAFDPRERRLGIHAIGEEDSRREPVVVTVTRSAGLFALPRTRVLGWHSRDALGDAVDRFGMPDKSGGAGDGADWIEATGRTTRAKEP